MSDIVIFILLGDGFFFFHIPKSILKLCSEIQVNYLDLVQSFEACFQALLGGPEQFLVLG